jgi:NAD(P)H-dependent flavin oxidoreductase YrpB (nitropropane dioxygenase family)
MLQETDMLKTSITEAFGLTTPIISAGMAFVAGPELAAAVANAGGLGMLGTGRTPPEGLRHMIRHTRGLTHRAFGVDLIGDFVEDGHIEVLCEEKVPLAVFFWSPQSAMQVARLKAAGVRFWMQVGTLAEAHEAASLGVEARIVQGSEAGGHNRAEAPLARLFPAVKAALPGLPLIASGGIMDGRTLLAALAMGAEAAWCGTRFLASEEAAAHPAYKRRVVAAKPGDTEITAVFGPEWPGQPLRAITNAAVVKSRGRNEAALRESEGETIGTVRLGSETVPVPRYSTILPNREFEADLDWACLTAGECAGMIEDILPAGDIVRRMTAEASDLLAALWARAA